MMVTERCCSRVSQIQGKQQAASSSRKSSDSLLLLLLLLLVLLCSKGPWCHPFVLPVGGSTLQCLVCVGLTLFAFCRDFRREMDTSPVSNIVFCWRSSPFDISMSSQESSPPCQTLQVDEEEISALGAESTASVVTPSSLDDVQSVWDFEKTWCCW